MDFVDKGIEYLKFALIQDENNKKEDALKNYIKSFEYLLTGIKYLKNENLKNKIQFKIKEFMPRAEQLKNQLENKNAKKKLFFFFF